LIGVKPATVPVPAAVGIHDDGPPAVGRAAGTGVPVSRSIRATCPPRGDSWPPGVWDTAIDRDTEGTDVSEGDIDREHFRRKLLQLRAELRASEQAGNADADTVELDQQRQGRLSRMDALSAQAMTLETQRRRRAALRRCEAALGRIETGAYGLCVRCDEDIDPRRLAFDPTLLLCIACASRDER